MAEVLEGRFARSAARCEATAIELLA